MNAKIIDDYVHKSKNVKHLDFPKTKWNDVYIWILSRTGAVILQTKVDICE